MAELAFEQATIHLDSNAIGSDYEGDDQVSLSDRQTSLNKCRFEPSDHLDLGSETPRPVAGGTRARRRTVVNSGVSLRDGVDCTREDEVAAAATGMAATILTKFCSCVFSKADKSYILQVRWTNL